MNYDVVSIADACADLILVGNEKPAFGQAEVIADSYEIELGGSGSIFGSQVAKLGGKVALISLVGNDPLGDIILARMKDIGIDTAYIRTSNTSKTALSLNISVQQDRAMLTVLGTLQEITFDLVPETIFDKTKHWHIAGYFLMPHLQPHWVSFLQKLKAKKITTSLDTNWAPDGNWKAILQLLPYIDIFLPNENEAMAITRQDHYKKAGQVLSTLCKLVVIKKGSEGASIFSNLKEMEQPIPPAILERISVVDTTGAGDSFDGGFIFEWLKGSTLEQCLSTAIACGTANVQSKGGINGQLIRS